MQARKAVMLWIRLMFEVGPDFHHHPACRDLLDDTLTPPSARAFSLLRVGSAIRRRRYAEAWTRVFGHAKAPPMPIKCSDCTKTIPAGQESRFPLHSDLYCLKCLDKHVPPLSDTTVILACGKIKNPVPEPNLKMLRDLGFEFMNTPKVKSGRKTAIPWNAARTYSAKFQPCFETGSSFSSNSWSG